MGDEPARLPRPVGIATRHLKEIQDCYVGSRDLNPPTDSLGIALTRTLKGTDLEEVLEFIDGKRDTEFGRGSGDGFKRLLQTNLEALYRELLPYLRPPDDLRQGVGEPVVGLDGSLAVLRRGPRTPR